MIFGLCGYHLIRAEYQNALSPARELHSLAETTGDPPLLAAGHSLLGNTLIWLGDLRPAVEHFERAMALYDPRQHLFHTSFSGTDTDIRSRIFRALLESLS